MATAVSAQLMALDAWGDQAVELHIRSCGGVIGAALTVMDTVAAMGVPVAAVCTGAVEGPAIGVLATCHLRLAGGHSRLRLSAPLASATGTASDLSAAVARHRDEVARYVDLVAAAVRQPAERVEVDLAQGRYFDVEEAIRYQLLDAVWGRSDHS